MRLCSSQRFTLTPPCCRPRFNMVVAVVVATAAEVEQPAAVAAEPVAEVARAEQEAGREAPVVRAAPEVQVARLAASAEILTPTTPTIRRGISSHHFPRRRARTSRCCTNSRAAQAD